MATLDNINTVILITIKQFKKNIYIFIRHDKICKNWK